MQPSQHHATERQKVQSAVAKEVMYTATHVLDDEYIKG